MPAAVGVPLTDPVLLLKVTPLGKAPDSLRVGVGVPVAITVKAPFWPTLKVALLALVSAQG